MPKQTKEPLKPVQKYRSGALSVSIWAHVGKNGDFYTVNAQRAYTDDDGETWKHTDSFSRDDLPTVGALLNRAWAWICTQEEKK
ncbi:MAG: hypothetical protein ACK4UN_09940 [Limisphaerales bacterium]